MAYAAVTSLSDTLNLIAYSCSSPSTESLDNPTTPLPTNTPYKHPISHHLETAYAAVTSLFRTPELVDSSPEETLHNPNTHLPTSTPFQQSISHLETAYAAVTSLFRTPNLVDSSSNFSYPSTDENLHNPNTSLPTNTLFEQFNTRFETAYAAVTSLFRTPDLVDSSPLNYPAYPSIEEILEPAGRAVDSLLEALERFDEIKNNSQGVMDVDARIRDEARKLEDALEFHISSQFRAYFESHGSFHHNLHDLRYDVDDFANTAAEMIVEYEEELKKQPAPHVEDPTTSHSGGGGDDWGDMVGSPRWFLDIRDNAMFGPDCHSMAITGMAGVGKTTLAKKLFHDPLVVEKFERRAFVLVGREYEFEEILRAIIAQIIFDSDNMIMGGDENIYEYFQRCLMKGRNFLIMLDDVWDENFEPRFKRLLPIDDRGENFFLLTTRKEDTYKDEDDDESDRFIFQMPLLKDDESWELLQRKVFGKEEECPVPLVKFGKTIAEKCEGLPLLILTVAQLLSEAVEKEAPEFWEEVAEMRNSVFNDAMDQIYEVLVPSYHYLNQGLKACFLYMAVFPKNYIVRRSRVINLWIAERIIPYREDLDSLFDDLVSNNLVVVRQKDYSETEAKACNLHVVYRHVSRREGENSKFFHILDTYSADEDGGSVKELVKDKRRVAIYHNTLLAMKEMHNSIASVLNLRSVLCTGPYHQYQVPVFLELKLLRVLDAVSIRFYEFPVEVTNLIQLKYLSLTTNANIPPSINKLWFLEFLIVNLHLRINRKEAESYLPVEIWDLLRLKHLRIVGRNLPHPPPGFILPNLFELLDVGIQSCCRRVLESIPKLRKLRIQIESLPDPQAPQSLNCFDHISRLKYLRSLQTEIVNPSFSPKPIVPPRLLSDCFSSMKRLRKLRLSGFGYPWEDMSIIAGLSKLEVLKLQSYAFRGEKWEAEGHIFPSLHHIFIEDADIVHWTATRETFPELIAVYMKNCHKLKEIPPLDVIYLGDCNPLAVTSSMLNGTFIETRKDAIFEVRNAALFGTSPKLKISVVNYSWK